MGNWQIMWGLIWGYINKYINIYYINKVTLVGRVDTLEGGGRTLVCLSMGINYNYMIVSSHLNKLREHLYFCTEYALGYVSLFLCINNIYICVCVSTCAYEPACMYIDNELGVVWLAFMAYQSL